MSEFMGSVLAGFLAGAGMDHGSVWLALMFWVMVGCGLFLVGAGLGWAGWRLWFRRQVRVVVRTAEVIAERAVKRK